MSAWIGLALMAVYTPITMQPTGELQRRLNDATAVVVDARRDAAVTDWNRALCVVVFPRATNGVMSCRAGESWTAPLFMTWATAVPQAVAQSDLVLLVVDESGLERLLRSPLKLGADTPEIVSFARERGAFVGADLAGAQLAPDDRANRAAYGAAASPRRVLATRELSAPTAAAPFIRALGGGRSSATASTAGAEPATPRESQTPNRSRAADDVRARLLDMQQTIDRLLADTTPAAVGTTGTPGDPGSGGMVTVERSRLVQLRQQLEAAIGALGR